MDALQPGIRVAVVAAMQPELRPLVKRFGLRREAPGPPVWRGRAASHELVAAVSSMGTRAATRCTERLLELHAVDHVCVVGIAGAIAPQLRIGELLHPEAVLDEDSGRRVHPKALGDATPRGVLLTTDALHRDPQSLERLRSHGYLAVDMETAAIGAVAEDRGLPWSVFRAISDHAGDPRLDQRVLGLARPDGTPEPAAIARLLIGRPWRVPTLVRLGRGMRAAVRASSHALFRALGAEPAPAR
jgi:nucleoside phosphorylase